MKKLSKLTILSILATFKAYGSDLYKVSSAIPKYGKQPHSSDINSMVAQGYMKFDERKNRVLILDQPWQSNEKSFSELEIRDLLKSYLGHDVQVDVVPFMQMSNPTQDRD